MFSPGLVVNFALNMHKNNNKIKQETLQDINKFLIYAFFKINACETICRKIFMKTSQR